MSQTPPSDKLKRDAFFTDGMKVTLLALYPKLPESFDINYLGDELSELAEKPFNPDEIYALRERAKTGMKSLKKRFGFTIDMKRTPANHLITNYTKPPQNES